jgi:uncharacterized DUF497 family protein
VSIDEGRASRQLEAIQDLLLRKHGLSLATGTINDLACLFGDYLRAFAYLDFIPQYRYAGGVSTCYRYIEWDEGNIWKNEIKHGVTAEEFEQCFNNPPFVIFPDKKIPDRRVLLGQTFGGRFLFVVFQHQFDEVARPIHARDMKMNERRIYEKQTR